ncbi:exo-beta-N-acetylmuramidase NamZ family protein [Kordia zhangzhouensis]|uniref:exo-beta-N-acetylmuramidase NamZ family protein n=1 Tax=Kordia zhangzhouensis TaxID=1620405 RepID=UPI0006291DB0
MVYRFFKNTFLLLLMLAFFIRCGSREQQNNRTVSSTSAVAVLTDTTLEKKDFTKKIIVGANKMNEWLPKLSGKRVGIVANQTSVVFKPIHTYTHLVDTLVALKVAVKTVFSPEHGFRGNADAGEIVKDGKDVKTGLPIISLYGKNKKPFPNQLENLDVVIFDVQDVGVRFYTYISTLHYVMEACAEANIPVIILDRPNPNGHYVDGPILEKEFTSFVGMHPVPIVHGMTIGEYAQMINGEQWLSNGIQCQLNVIPVENYTHQTPYSLPIKPSPNLPNDQAINLYPSLCLFEGTDISVGRGTEQQFQVIGTPRFDLKHFDHFTPKPNFGAKNPKHNGLMCNGYDLSKHEKLQFIKLTWLIDFYKKYQTSQVDVPFFNKNNFFAKLAGTDKLQQQIEAGMSETDIKATWQKGLQSFKKIRDLYLIYE